MLPLKRSTTRFAASGLTGVQLHFDAAPDLPAKIRERFGPSLRILRVLHFDAPSADEKIGFVSGHDFSRAERTSKSTWALAPEDMFADPNVDATLIDSRTPSAVGGTGHTFDWLAASKTLFQGPNAQGRVVVAGGLSPENVAEAIATLRPWGVDVVSGVESAPGRKDPLKVKEFVARATAVNRRSVANSLEE